MFRERRRRAESRTGDAVHLNIEQQQVVLDAIVKDLAELPIEPKIMAVTDVHVHLLAVFGEVGIRPTVGRLKSRATKELKLCPDWGMVKRTWAKGCHMESLETDDDQWAAYEYIRKHESQGVVHSWITPSQADGSAVDRAR